MLARACVSEGVGAATGGIGVDQFTIEEVVAKHTIPIHAVIIKVSIQESASPITEEILEGAGIAVARVNRIIKEGTKERDTVLVAGIENTIGIGQYYQLILRARDFPEGFSKTFLNVVKQSMLYLNITINKL